MRQKQPGCYLRFGRADIDIALGLQTSGSQWTPERMREMRRAFLLSDPHQLKSLEIECNALRPEIGMARRRIEDREALSRLNAVGACFLDSPMCSYGALSAGPRESVQALLDEVRGAGPILLYANGTSPQAACARLTPTEAISCRVTNEAGVIDRLEQTATQALRGAVPYPVIAMGLGVVGRLLALRLIRNGFAGFILDMDDLAGIPFGGGPKGGESKPSGWRQPKAERKPQVQREPEAGVPVRWEGPFLGNFSFSVINRELCTQLSADPRIALTIRPSDVPFMVDAIPEDRSRAFGALVERVAKPLGRAAEVHVENHVQHPFRPPSEGRWVAIQPWDYMSLPARWLDWIRGQVDEVWVPSNFVRQAYLEAGIEPERVVVIPNGVDTRTYRPGAPKVGLNSKKRFKFLFVGGPFWRKGFDVLLEAYGRAFSAKDDVTLVVKAAPDFWTEAGARQLAEFRGRSGAPEVLHIVQSLEPSRMAGLYAACDCLVHPYRAEGFAMCVAEGMASGLPVIVTERGGTADFCNEATAFLIPASLRHLERKQIDDQPTLDYPGYAEPDAEALRQHMRFVYEHRREAEGVARAGMAKIRTEFTWERAAERAVQRLTDLQDRPIRRGSGGD